jgi:hypothetical protein
MKTNNSILLCVAMVLAYFVTVGCNRPDTRLKIINNSNKTIIPNIGGGLTADTLYDNWYGIYESCAIAPFSSGTYRPPLRNDGKWEQYFGTEVYLDTAAFWILNADNITDVHNKQQIKENILQRYDITLQDLINLNWEITYPPSPAMKDIKMYPPYNVVVENK